MLLEIRVFANLFQGSVRVRMVCMDSKEPVQRVHHMQSSAGSWGKMFVVTLYFNIIYVETTTLFVIILNDIYIIWTFYGEDL